MEGGPRKSPSFRKQNKRNSKAKDKDKRPTSVPINEDKEIPDAENGGNFL